MNPQQAQSEQNTDCPRFLTSRKSPTHEHQTNLSPRKAPKMTDNFLTIEEKRAWLARIFRDTSGEYTDADKFKAMQEDTNLALIQQNQQTAPRKRNKKYRK
jgi:hypothetical protein